MNKFLEHLARIPKPTTPAVIVPPATTPSNEGAAPMDKTLDAVRDAIDEARKYADQVKAVVDTLAGTVTSIPLVGQALSGYVGLIRTGVDALAAAIDAADDAIDKADPKPAS